MPLMASTDSSACAEVAVVFGVVIVRSGRQVSAQSYARLDRGQACNVHLIMPTLSTSGCEIHYTAHDLTAPWIDDKQFIVFHHGLGASSGTWAGWLPALADRFRIVSFDMRGHGRSSHPSADTALSLDLLADDIF